MHLIWPQAVEHDNIMLLVSNVAPYMVKTGSAIQVLFPKMLYVTCIVHILYRVAKKILNDFPLIHNVISSAKKVFQKSSARIQRY